MEIALLVPPKDLPIHDQIQRTFTTSELNLDFVHQFKCIGVKIDLVNNDSTNTIQYSMNNGTLITLEQDDALNLENIQIENIRIMPNGATGSGFVLISITYIDQIPQYIKRMSKPLPDINLGLQKIIKSG